MKNIIMVICVCFLGGCAVSSDGDDGAPTTMGDACLEFGEAICARIDACAGGIDQNACLSDFMLACCIDDESCDEDPLIKSSAAWDKCLEAYDTFSCESIGNGALPRECLEAASF